MKCLLILLFLCFQCISFAQSFLNDAIRQLVNDEQVEYGEVGIAVLDAKTGQVIATHNEHKSLIPASALKAVTTLSALELLGKDYQFKTELQHDGEIVGGILKGNLYLKGFGDPTLGSDQMEAALDLSALLKQLTDAVKKAGIQKIQGKIIGDASYFKGIITANTWQWYDLGNYYASGAWGLNLHENFYYLNFQQQSQLGAKPPIAKIEPLIPNLYFINEVQSAASNTGDNAYLYGGPFAYTRVARGTIPVGDGLFQIKGAIPDPPFFAASTLLNALEISGVETAKQASTQRELNLTQKRTTLFTHYSPTLIEIAQRANFESVNLYCESLIRAIGAKQNGDDSLLAGIEAIQNYWASQDIDTEGWFLMDGSGLSPRNGITPLQLAQILQKATKDVATFKVFYTTLPIGGKTGTVKYLFQNSSANGKIRLKSGSIERVRAYTGYAQGKNEQMLVFALMVNNYIGSSSSLRRKMERLMESLCK